MIELQRTTGITSFGAGIVAAPDSAAVLSDLGTDALYADAAHNHDSAYAALSHNHTGVYSPVSHTHTATAVTIAGDSWSGSLAGSGVKDPQDLADWIDANVPAGG